MESPSPAYKSSRAYKVSVTVLRPGTFPPSVPSPPPHLFPSSPRSQTCHVVCSDCLHFFDRDPTPSPATLPGKEIYSLSYSHFFSSVPFHSLMITIISSTSLRLSFPSGSSLILTLQPSTPSVLTSHMRSLNKANKALEQRDEACCEHCRVLFERCFSSFLRFLKNRTCMKPCLSRTYTDAYIRRRREWERKMELKVTDDYRRAEEGVRSEAVKEAYRFKQEVEDGVYRWGVENGYGEEAEERRERERQGVTIVFSKSSDDGGDEGGEKDERKIAKP
mmetsp:Transcript_15267/g.31129  ORF Transcript_15267/g.31129 Transcript_15267/m.31129 type:complete len:277 (-) Transcript_15267:35-865(-)